MSDGADILRRRQAALDDAAQPPPDGGDEGSEAIVIQTTQVGTYPITAGDFYAVVRCDVGGDEAEGQPGVLSPIKGVFYALNVGTSVPPKGSFHVARRVGVWTFRF